MREIGTLDDQSQAQRLADYLQTRDISAQVRPERNGWSIWIHREDQVDQGRQELADYLANPRDPKYNGVEKAARLKRKQIEKTEREHLKNTINLRGRLNTVSPLRCPVTHTLIAISILVAVLTGVGSNYRALAPFYFSPPKVVLDERTITLDNGQEMTLPFPTLASSGLENLRRGELWRLFTPMFIHYGAPHLVFNMMALYWLGGLIELRKSWRVLLFLVLTASPVSFFAEYLWDVYRHGLNVPSLPGGMSGVIYALLGYAWMKSDYEPEAGIAIQSQTIVWMLLWLVACMLGVFGPIANAAHLSGLVFGMFVGLAPHLRDSLPWR